MKTSLSNLFNGYSLKIVAQNFTIKNDFNFLKSFFAMLPLLASFGVQKNRYAMVVRRTFIGVMFLSLTSSFNVVALPDLSVSTTISNQSPAVGADVTYTIKVKNINPDKATGVELTNTLPAGVTFKSFNLNGVGTATNITTSGVTTIVWNVGEVAGSTELTMTVVATVNKRGFWYNIAEITKETEQDTDSTPNNHLILEDDQDATCFSIEDFFYTGDEYTTQLPTGFTNIVWTKKVGVTGTPEIITGATAGVTLLGDGNIRVTSITAYTEFAFTANNGRCPVNGCCAIKFTPGLFGSIGSVVWSDVDGNGIKNTGETGMNGVTVELYDATDNTLLATDVTADGGRYLFSNLMSGSYKVKFILPTGRTFVTPNAPGSNSTNDSDAGVGGFSNTIAIDVTKPAGDVGRDNLTIGAGIVSDCIVSAGTLTTTTSNFCLPAVSGSVVLTATTGVSPVVPAGFSVSYILTKGSTNTIQQISSTPSFSVTLPDAYKIFTLVYNANSGSTNFLNLSNIIFGVTRASDLATSISTSSTVCAQLDATGVSFNVNTTPAAPFILGTTICSGGTVVLGTPGVTDPVFQWFTSAGATTPFATTSSITVSPSVTTTYFLSIVNSSSSTCPSEKASVTVAVNPKPTTPTVLATLSNNCAINATSVNLADAITSTVSAGGTFEWHTTNSTSSPIISNPTAIGAGTYFLFEKSSNGCYSDGAMVVVNITTCQCTNPPAVSLTALLPICGGTATPVQLNAILSGGATSGTWTTDGTGTFDNAASTTAKYTPSAADMIDGSIILTFKTNDPDGAVSLCNAALANTILTIKAKPVAPFNLKSDTLICLGSSAKLFAVSVGNTIQWYNSATSTTPIGIGSDLGFSVTPAIEGTVTYYAEATSADGCVSDRTSISFKVKKCFTDLAVVKTVISSPDIRTSPSYLLGQDISYTIDARNVGTIGADNVTLTDILPQGATFVSAIPAGQYNSTTGVWNIGSLSEGSNKILLVNVKLTKIGSIVNTATITGANDDPSKLANNTSSATVNVVERADLSLSKTVSNSTPHVGDTLTYTLTVSNAGPNTATNVEVKDALPTSLAFLSSSDVTNSSGVLTGVTTSIASGVTKQFNFKVKVLSAGGITNSAEITKSDQPDPDSTPGNGTSNSEDDRSSVTVTATELCNLVAPVITATNSVICLNAQTTLTATGCAGSTIIWSSGQTNVASITVSPTTSRTYTAYCQKDACQSPSSNVVSITVSNIVAPTLSASQGTICAGESSVLTATGCSGIVEWQVTGLPTGNTLTVTPSASQTFTAKCKASGCESPLASVNVIVTQKPNAPDIIAEKTEICPSESVTLVALNCNGTVRWSTGQTTTSILVTPQVSTSYNAVCTVNGCISNASLSKVINVVPIPAPTIRTTASSVCPGGSVTLNADGCSGTVTWYYDDKTATGASLTVTPTKSTSYAVTCSTAFCTSVKSAQTVITVENPAIPVITSATSSICLGSSVQLTASGCNGTINWSDGQKGAIVSVSPAVTTSYTATCSIGVCTSSASLNRVITVTQASAPVIASDKTTICLGQAITLTATGCVGTIRWSDGTTGIPKVIVPSANIKYTATCESSVCLSSQSNELSFVVNTTPSIVSPVTTNTILVSGATADLTKLVTSTAPTGTTLVFKTTNSPTTNTVLNPTAVGVGTYYAFYQSADGCYSAGTRIIVFNGATITEADVAIKIDADRTSAKLNEDINFLISVTNNGPGTARNIVINNPLPAGLEFVSSSTGLTVSGGKIVISFDSLERTQVKTFAYVAKMKVTTSVTNPASVTSFKDTNPTNDNSSVIINGDNNGTNADLSLLKSVSNFNPIVGDTITYTLTINNAGPSTATNVEVKDIIPLGMAFVSTNNTIHTSGLITGTVASIPSGSSQVFTYKVKVLTSGTFTSAAEISKSDQPDPDSTPANGTNNNEDDRSSVTIRATELCNLKAPDISSDKLTVCLGKTITLTATGCTGTVRWSDGSTGTPYVILPADNIKYTATCETASCISPKSNELSFGVNVNGGFGRPSTINTVIAVGARTDLTKLVISETPAGTTLVFKTINSPAADIISTPTSVGVGAYYAYYRSLDGCYSFGSPIIVGDGITTFNADLAVKISSDKSTAKLDENINFEISLSNNGPATAKNIVITNPLPAGLEFISSSTGQVVSGGKIVINQDSLAYGRVVRFNYVAKIKVVAAVTNPVSITSLKDNNPINDTSSVVVNGVNPVACKVGLAMAITNASKITNDVYYVTYRIIAKNFCKDTLRNINLTSNLANTFKAPLIATIIQKPEAGIKSKLNVNTAFGLLDSNLVNQATSYMLPEAIDTIVYTVQVKLNGSNGSFYSQANISGKRPTNEILTALSSDGTDVNGTPSMTVVTLGDATRIGLAKELVTSGLKRVSTNVWTVPYRIRVVNMGTNTITKLSVRDSLGLTFTSKGAAIASKPIVTTTKAGITINPNYSGFDANANLLVDTLSTLAKGDTAIINLTVTINVSAATDSVFNNLAIGTGLGTDKKSSTDVSTNGVNPDANGDLDPNNDNEVSPVVLPKDRNKTSIGVSLSAVTDTNPQSDGSYNVYMTLTAKNYDNVLLKNIVLSNDLAKTIGNQVNSWSVIGSPILVRGTNTILNLKYNGRGDSLLVESTSALLPGDSIVINYLVNITKKPLIDTLYTHAYAKAVTLDNLVQVTDFSVNGNNPDPNKDGNPSEKSPTPIILPRSTTVDSCRVGLAMAVTQKTMVSSGVYNVTYQLIAKNFCKDTLRNITLTHNLASTFKTPTTAMVVSTPRLGVGSKLVVNNTFGLLDSNLVSKAISYMLPNAIDTITYVVQVKTNGITGPFNSQAQIKGSRPNSGETLTAKSSNGTNVNANPGITPLVLETVTTKIGLAKELVTSGLKRISNNVWTIPYRIKIVNMGTTDIKKLSIRDSLGVVFVSKGALVAAQPIVTTTKAGITINPNYIGFGANANLLVDSLSTLARGDSAVINLTITIDVSAATDSVFNNVAIGTGVGTDNKSYTDVSTNGVNPDVNGDLDPSNDNVTTKVTLPKTTISNSKGSVGISLAAVTDTNPQPNGSYNVKFTLRAKNYGNAILNNVALSNDLAKTIASQVGSFTVSQTPTLVSGGLNTVLNSKFNGVTDTLLTVGSSSALSPGDSIIISYTINVFKKPLIDTIYTIAYAKAVNVDNLTSVTDFSVNGNTPDPNKDGNPVEKSLTPVYLKALATTTKIGLAKELLTTAVKRDSDNIWTVPYRIRVVNMGTTNIRYLSVRDSLNLVFVSKGATIVTKPTVTTTKAGITINPNYTGSGINANLLVDSSSTLAKGDTAIIDLTVRVNVSAATDSVFNNVAIGTGLGTDSKSYTDVSTNGANPDGNGDLNPNNDNVATPVTLPKGAILNLKGVLGVSLAVTDTSRSSDGSYNVTLRLKAKNYGNVSLRNISISNNLAATIGDKVKMWSILGSPILLSGSGANTTLNLKFNGRRDTLLVDSTTALLPGDSIVISYIVNIDKNPLIDTLYTFAYAKAMTSDNLAQVTDFSVNGENPDPNGDGKPLEASPTPIILPRKTTKVSIPHGFSPNGDGINDTFVIGGVNPDERASVEVYNRWGSLVYVSEDYKNDWDGRPNTGVSLIEVGSGLPSGTYFYIVTIYKRATGEKVALPVGVEPVRYMTISR